MNNRLVLISCGISVMLLVAYLATSAGSSILLTRLNSGGFAAFFLVAAAISGFNAYGFGQMVANRLLRRLVMVVVLVLTMFASGSTFRAVGISQLFKGELTQAEDKLQIVEVEAGSLSLRSPYTRTVFSFPSTIPASGNGFFSPLLMKCVRVRIELTAAGDKRIAPDQPPITEADVAECPSR